MCIRDRGIEEEVVPKEADEEEDAEVESGNESEGTQPEEVKVTTLNIIKFCIKES